MKKFQHYSQLNQKDCGPTCLKMVARHHGKTMALAKITALSETTRMGSTLAGVAEAAERLGFRTLGVKIDFAKFSQEAPLPALLHWQGNHYVVVYRISATRVWVADPAHGLLQYTHADFIARWVGHNATPTTREGIALLLEPTPAFYQSPEDQAACPYPNLPWTFQTLFHAVSRSVKPPCSAVFSMNDTAKHGGLTLRESFLSAARKDLGKDKRTRRKGGLAGSCCAGAKGRDWPSA